MDITYKVGELKRLISESSEFNPTFGNGVEGKNKSINDKAYKEAKTRRDKYNPKSKKDEDFARGDAKYEKFDDNRTTLGANPDGNTPENKKRISAQMHGYTSDAESKNGIEKAADFSKNKEIADGITKKEDEINKNKALTKSLGLTGRNTPKSAFEKETIYESEDGVNMRQTINKFKSNFYSPKLNEKKNTKTVFFKKTTFLTEGHMISKIPDEFKKDGEQFTMKDKTGSEYVVEWRNNNATILSHKNKSGMVESVNKFNSLAEYNEKTSSSSQVDNSINESNASKSFQDSLNKMREIMKQNN